MRNLILIGALAALTACTNYTDQTSPCIGRTGKPVVSRNDSSLVLSFAPPESRAATDHDCLFRPVGSAS